MLSIDHLEKYLLMELKEDVDQEWEDVKGDSVDQESKKLFQESLI